GISCAANDMEQATTSDRINFIKKIRLKIPQFFESFRKNPMAVLWPSNPLPLDFLLLFPSPQL
ncbi:hypothetical protein N9199_02045, partial [bacterium]|nr:hypothetical protein [bacterium]